MSIRYLLADRPIASDPMLATTAMLRVFGCLPDTGARGRTEAGVRKPLTVPHVHRTRSNDPAAGQQRFAEHDRPPAEAPERATTARRATLLRRLHLPGAELERATPGRGQKANGTRHALPLWPSGGSPFNNSANVSRNPGAHHRVAHGACASMSGRRDQNAGSDRGGIWAERYLFAFRRYSSLASIALCLR